MILLVIALWIGLALAERRSERHGVSRDELNAAVFYGLLAFIFGGRLGFVLENLPSFVRSPLDIFSISPSIFDPVAALAAAGFAIVLHVRRRALPGLGTLDALVPVLAALGVGLALSHLAAESAYGKPSELPWAIQSRGALRHPSQIYELLAALATLRLVWWLPAGRPGQLTLNLAAFTAGWRLLLEAFRGDSSFVLGGARFAQVLAAAALALCFLGFELLDRRAVAPSPPPPPTRRPPAKKTRSPRAASKRKK